MEIHTARFCRRLCETNRVLTRFDYDELLLVIAVLSSFRSTPKARACFVHCGGHVGPTRQYRGHKLFPQMVRATVARYLDSIYPGLAQRMVFSQIV